jgi:ABC-2 type transport system permease protein
MTEFRLEVRRNRAALLGLAIAIGGYAAVMGLMYPIVQANDELMRQYMDTFPKAFLAAFGMTGVLSDPGVFFTTYIASWLWPIIAVTASLLIGTRAVAADLDRGFLDLPLATPLTRTRYLAASIGGQVMVLGILAAVAVLALWITGRLVGAEFDLVRFGLAGLLAFAFGCAVAGATTLLSVVTLRRGLAAGVVGGAVILMYLVFVVGQISTDWSWIGALSAWNHLPTTKVIDEGMVPVGDLALFAAVALGGWALALVAFRSRDLSA